MEQLNKQLEKLQQAATRIQALQRGRMARAKALKKQSEKPVFFEAGSCDKRGEGPPCPDKRGEGPPMSRPREQSPPQEYQLAAAAAASLLAARAAIYASRQASDMASLADVQATQLQSAQQKALQQVKALVLQTKRQRAVAVEAAAASARRGPAQRAAAVALAWATRAEMAIPLRLWWLSSSGTCVTWGVRKYE